ncbi:Eukaryotic translation initiation factor 2D [Hordeum vulgare]|nr:Eukaryotic translation initiation factor 2D [Hordeum vulgare]
MHAVRWAIGTKSVVLENLKKRSWNGVPLFWPLEEVEEMAVVLDSSVMGAETMVISPTILSLAVVEVVLVEEMVIEGPWHDLMVPLMKILILHSRASGGARVDQLEKGQDTKNDPKVTPQKNQNKKKLKAQNGVAIDSIDIRMKGTDGDTYESAANSAQGMDEESTIQNIEGADKKKLRRTAKQRFPQASDDDLDVILPPKVEITVAKYPNWTLVYGIEGEFPMLFDIDGRGHELFPTVYALWKVPYLLPVFTLRVVKFHTTFLVALTLCFLVSAYPQKDYLLSKLASHGQLKSLVTMLQLLASADGRYVPNEGFYDDMVIEDPNFASASQHIYSSEDPSEAKQDKAVVDVSECHSEDLAINSETIEDLTAGVSELNFLQEKTTEEKEHQHLSTEEIDYLLDICLLQALHTNVKDKDLPIPGSILLSNHILPCRPLGVTLDIKKSSHKKLSKWLQSKSSSSLISTKEDKHKKEVILVGISRKHPDYTAFKHQKKVQEPVEQHGNIVGEGSSTKQVEVDEISKSSSHVNPIFLAVNADTGKCYSASEVFDVVFRYVEKENLVKQTDKAKVILDATLCDALYKGAVKKGSTYPSKRGQHEVLIQGGVIENLAKHLVDHHGVPKRYIEVYDKTKK